MVLLGRNSGGSSAPKVQTALFDIRIQGADHDVLVIKGPPNEANSVLLSGTIVLSVLEPIHVKKLNLKLYATLRLKWTNTYENQRGTIIKKPYRYEKRIFEHTWDNFDLQAYFSNLYENYGSKTPMMFSGRSSANSSSSSLKSFGAKKSKSSSNLVSFGSSTSLNQQSNLLVQGNYEFPFSAILPGSTFESVEGLPGASVVYKLQATFERGRFSNDLVTKKHLRIVRTLTPDAVELSETIAVDNTWPKKVEYTISIPQRAVAIGSSIQVNMILVPLIKGLKLGNIKITLAEFFSCSGSYGPSHSGDRTIVETKPTDSEKDVTEDRWEINTSIPIPPSLSKCAQDVDILTNIKVRHKLKFSIGLINPEGHTSELRASLPIVLFISPFVAVGVKNYDRKDSVADNSSAAFAEISSDPEDVGDDDEVIFAPDPDLTPAMASAANLKHEEDLERQAPPNYENHIYDRLWNEVSVEHTPEHSQSQTPDIQTPNGTPQNETLNVNKLSETLRNLHLQRLNEQNQLSLNSLATISAPHTSSQSRTDVSGFTFGSGDESDEDDDDADDEADGISFNASVNPRAIGASSTPINHLGSESDYFSIKGSGLTNKNINLPGVVSPGYTPGFNHISRANSASNLASQASTSSRDWSTTNLTDVPSYQVAMKSPTFDEFSPAYEPPEEISSPKSIYFKTSSLNNSRAQSTAYLSNLRGVDHGNDSNLKSKTSSNNSSPAQSRNASSTKLSAGINNNNTIYSKSPSKSKILSTGSLSFSAMTPLSVSPSSRDGNNSESLSSSSQSRPTLSNQNKSGSFVNLMGSLMHKKDKKS